LRNVQTTLFTSLLILPPLHCCTDWCWAAHPSLLHQWKLQDA